jgi:hypothetical protein
MFSESNFTKHHNGAPPKLFGWAAQPPNREKSAPVLISDRRDAAAKMGGCP